MASSTGEWVRTTTQFRDWVVPDGSAGFRPEPGRYHLYVSYACPWAHRAIIVRKLKGLEQAITMSAVDPIRDARGWAFREAPGGETDPIGGFSFLSEVYQASTPGYDGYVSVPVLWDRETRCVVNNESADLAIMLNGAWNELAENPELDLYPSDLRDEIDQLNARVYQRVNNGVYRAGFATSQDAYEEAAGGVFAELDALEERLGTRRYLLGERITLADWRLFTTLLRFDPVYHGHFKCNLRRVIDYPSLWGYLRDLLSEPGIGETFRLDDIKRHYYATHPNVNPSRIVAIGPALDYDEPHGREALST